MFPFVTVFNDLEHIKIKELSDFQRLQIAKVKKKKHNSSYIFKATTEQYAKVLATKSKL